MKSTSSPADAVGIHESIQSNIIPADAMGLHVDAWDCKTCHCHCKILSEFLFPSATDTAGLFFPPEFGTMLQAKEVSAVSEDDL